MKKSEKGEGPKVEMTRMKTKPFLPLLAALALTALPAFADHGPTASTQRDPWIDSSLEDLVQAGLVDSFGRPVSQMTNLEVAQATVAAAKKLQSPDETASSQPLPTQAKADESLDKLVQEFKGELALMDVAKLEDRIHEEERRNGEFAALQQEYLKRTGTQVTGYARGYFDTYRGFGPNAAFSSMSYNDVMFADILLKSVPVPFVLFDADLRLTRTIGFSYADPIQPEYNLRWLSLTNVNEVANLTAGDFYQHYTPLTLWNSEIPVYTLTEPSSYERVRKDVEELAYLDHGPDWHMRGFELASDQALSDASIPLSSFHGQAMAGELQSAAQYSFAQDYAGGEAGLDFFNDKVEIKVTGLSLWDQSQYSDVPYIPGLFSSYSQQYQIGSLLASGNLSLQDDANIIASVEVAGSRYQEDATNPQSVLEDSAVRGVGTLNLSTLHVTAKYLYNGPYFYSPGAQTNRYTPYPGTAGYLSTNQNLDDALPGYLNNYVFQGVNRPGFAPYDRIAENILPYGDASPNREGFVFNGSVGLGKDGWLVPQAQAEVGMKEVQPNLILLSSGGTTSVDGLTEGRNFTGIETALTANLSKALDGLPSTCDVSFDYKYQETDLGLSTPFVVNTFIASADAGPFPDRPLLDGLILSLAYEQAQASGSEFVLNSLGNPPTLAQYPDYLDSNLADNSYTYQTLGITRTSWAFGARLPLSKSAEVHADYFINQYTWTSQPSYGRQDQIWRVTYELTF